MSTPDLDALNIRAPLISSRRRDDARTLDAPLGDGHHQGSPDGINSIRRIWSLNWTLDATDRDALLAFLRARQGVEPFLWTEPGAASQSKWVARKWSPGESRNARFAFSATFEESFAI